MQVVAVGALTSEFSKMEREAGVLRKSVMRRPSQKRPAGPPKKVEP